MTTLLSTVTVGAQNIDINDVLSKITLEEKFNILVASNRLYESQIDDQKGTVII